MKFAIALYKALGIGIILGYAVIVVLVAGLVATVLADRHYGMAGASTVNHIRLVTMIVFSLVGLPVVYTLVRRTVRAKITA